MEWARRVHSTTWYCTMYHAHEDVGTKNFDSKGNFIHHLSRTHADALTRPQILAQARRNKTTGVRDPFTCPLCDCCPNDVSPRIAEKPYELLSKHVARHLKALSFFSLSYIDYQEDCSNSSDAASQSDENAKKEISNAASHQSSWTASLSGFETPPLAVPSVAVEEAIEPPESDEPFIWPTKIFPISSEPDRTLERLAAAKEIAAFKEAAALAAEHQRLTEAKLDNWQQFMLREGGSQGLYSLFLELRSSFATSHNQPTEMHSSLTKLRRSVTELTSLATTLHQSATEMYSALMELLKSIAARNPCTSSIRDNLVVKVG